MVDEAIEEEKEVRQNQAPVQMLEHAEPQIQPRQQLIDINAQNAGMHAVEQ